MANFDTMQPDFVRLLKVDGHLGALYNPEHDIIRLVCRAGTVDINLNDLRAKAAKRGAQQVQGQGA